MTTPSDRQVSVRRRQPADLPGAGAALVEVHRSDGYPVEGVDDPVAWLLSPHQIAAWVAELDGRIVGHVALSEPQPNDAAATVWTAHADNLADDVAVLGRLFVHPQARGHALGEQLARTATDYANEHGLRLVLDVMTKDAAAIRLYERLGWQRIGTTQHDDGRGHAIDAYCYVSPGE
jgi:ribosomal protein S18 acetylase RimI-like enzyme